MTNTTTKTQATMSRSTADVSRPPVTNESTSATKNGVQMSSSTSPSVSATPRVDLLEQQRDEQAEAGRRHQRAAAAVRPPMPRDEAERGERAADQAVDDVGALDGASPGKMIGTSAPNSAATASAHSETQNPSRGPV